MPSFLSWARASAITGLFLLLGACSTVGADAPRAGAPWGGSGSAGASAPVVTDPAPYVSGTLRPYQIRGRWYHPAEDTTYDETGLASWYGDQFHGRPTATGERFDMYAMTAAHKTLALPALVEVTNLDNGRTLILRVNDRGPFVDGRIIDLSRGAADQLGMLSQGVGRVRVRYVGRAPRLGDGPVQYAAAPSAAPGPTPYQAPASGQISTPAVAPANADGSVWVQVGAFSDRRQARRALSRFGDHARMDEVSIDNQRLYRVVVGPWADANRAEQARLSVMARGYADAILL
jgi:rare lipoprotein A